VVKRRPEANAVDAEAAEALERSVALYQPHQVTRSVDKLPLRQVVERPMLQLRLQAV
jgi:hypothetical protein